MSGWDRLLAEPVGLVLGALAVAAIAVWLVIPLWKRWRR